MNRDAVTAKRNALGGFLQREKKQDTQDLTVLEAWTMDKSSWYFQNARSALSAYLRSSSHHNLWLPAYACKTLEVGHPFKTFPLEENSLQPNITFLQDNIGPNDAVLAVDYWGFRQSPQFFNYVRERTDVSWIQDCSQSLMPEYAWGDVQLFSPRKTLGVPGGGFLIAKKNSKLAIMRNRSMKPIHFFPAPDLIRSLDYADFALPIASKLNQRREMNQKINLNYGPRKTISILKSIEIAELAAKRLKNFQVLFERLGQFSLLKQSALIGAAPLGFPVIVENRDSKLEFLSKRGIYCAVHWREIIDNNAEYESKLSRSVITLPTDHRLDLDDMEYIATTFLESLNE